MASTYSVRNGLLQGLRMKNKDDKDDPFLDSPWHQRRPNGGASWAAWAKPSVQSRCTSQHGAVEKYNKRGKHLGEFDHETGEQTKDADKNREVEP